MGIIFIIRVKLIKLLMTVCLISNEYMTLVTVNIRVSQ